MAPIKYDAAAIAAYARSHPLATNADLAAHFGCSMQTALRAVRNHFSPDERHQRGVSLRTAGMRAALPRRTKRKQSPPETKHVWLAAALDAAAFCSVPKRRIGIIHRDRAFLDRVRELADCGTITTRPNGRYQWTVEGKRAVALAREMRPHMTTTLPLTEDQ